MWWSRRNDQSHNKQCSKLAQNEYETRNDLVSKVIHWDLCKKFKFDHSKNKYMHNPESFQENETYKLPWDFKLQTYHLISARGPDLVIVNKKRTG